eukprot:TRINITY_DN28097_c0_g1_i1.p1 TRINITY_DN28097_c0_g1~~TRINITY_DN28097_c0_g1_i1.p1  ORF type:complete len:405 (-),score=35.87 TRINITY_DN28097_c0_g1_i1:283-1497(-)
MGGRAFVLRRTSMLCILLALPFAAASPLGPMVATGELGEGRLSIHVGVQQKRSNSGRRLHLTSAPSSSFSVEDCATIAGLASAKRTALVDNSYTKCINVFGVLIIGHSASSTCGATNSMIFLANVVAELLDTNLDGAADDANVVAHIDSFSNCAQTPVLIVGCTQQQEEAPEGVMNSVGHTMSSQGWAVTGDASKAPLTEEPFHFVHQQGWAKAYPPFADTWTSTLGQCTKEAQCIWYRHPENSGCRSMAGVECANHEVACTGGCTSFNIPGQCYETEHSCGSAVCDTIEFFHKIFNAYTETNLGTDPSILYDFMIQNGAGNKAQITTKMQLTTHCTALFNDMRNTNQYKLPQHALTGVYTVSLPDPSHNTTCESGASGSVLGHGGVKAVCATLLLMLLSGVGV